MCRQATCHELQELIRELGQPNGQFLSGRGRWRGSRLGRWVFEFGYLDGLRREERKRSVGSTSVLRHRHSEVERSPLSQACDCLCHSSLNYNHLIIAP